MSAELEMAVALLYRRFRDGSATEVELSRLMSLTLGWAKPSEAPHLVDQALAAGLVEQRGEALHVLIDPHAVDVPFGFRPPEDLFRPVDDARTPAPPKAPAATDEDAAEELPASVADNPVLEQLISLIATRLEGGRKAAVAHVNAKQQELDGAIGLEGAALLVADGLGLDVRDQASEVLDSLGTS